MKRCVLTDVHPCSTTNLSQAPAAPVLARMNRRRREEDYTSAAAAPAEPVNIKRKKPNPKAEGARRSKNTAVYVRGLPADTSHDELIERFRKFGVLEEDDEGEPKVKMYAKDDGVFSGEALVVYFKEDSVTLACTMLDDAELRLGDSSTRMSVAKADFAHKVDGAEKAAPANGDKPRKTIDKKKATRRITNMQK
jgi:HIV Tat-specific factor 1